MNEELEETYIEVPTEDEYDYDDYEEEVGFGDIALITFIAILGCAVFAFVVKTISKHLKNVNLKIGNKIEIGVETKENTNDGSRSS